ncbi:MAG: AsmA family protein [Rhodospirillales bacterium]|nr:AsmA family protein [Rhodospirillales bacterium]
MSEDLQAKSDKGWETIVLRILKWLAILGVALFIGLTVLSRMGGNSPVLREAVEEFLTDATPYTARVGTLNSMRFFPNIVIDVTDVELRGGEDGTGEAQVRIDTAKLVMPLFDALYRPGHFKDLQIKNLKAMPGSMLAQSIEIQSLAIEDEGEQSALVIDGRVGKTPLKASFGLDVKGKPGAYTYVIGRERGFEATLADIGAGGTIRNTVTGDYKFENLVLKKAGQEVLHGNIDFDRGDDRLKVHGQLRIEPGKSRVDPDVRFEWPDDEKPLKISGEIVGPEIIVSDFDGSSELQKTIDALDKIFGTPGGKLDLDGLDVDLKLDIQQLKSGNVLLGKVETPLSIKNGELHMGPLSGTIVAGTLSGDVDIDAAKSPAEMTQKITVKNFDYTELQKRLSDEPARIEGHGNILMELSSQSGTLEGLFDSLSGKISFVGGRGKMRAGLLNLWGGGLLNALLPSFEEDSDLNMNCVVVNLDVENLKGRSDAVFVDTQARDAAR